MSESKFWAFFVQEQQDQDLLDSTNHEEYIYQIVPYQKKQTFALISLFCTVLWSFYIAELRFYSIAT